MTRLTLSRVLAHARSAVRSREDVRIREANGDECLVVKGRTIGVMAESIPEYHIVGCDLENYSGLKDLEQFVFGVLLEERLSNALRFAGVEQRILAANGTGDGFLMCFERVTSDLTFLFAMKLWLEGNRGYYDQMGRRRKLRVVLTRGPCLLGKDRTGSIKMQGYGLIETARILGCDKGTHFIVSKKLWHSRFGTKRWGEFHCKGWKCALRIAGRCWKGRAKSKDLHVTEFYNIVGTVHSTRGNPKRVRVGRQSSEGLRRPG